MDQVQVLTTIGAIAGFVLALIISFTRTKALIPVYAAAEGLMLGGISAIAEAAFSGIVLQAVAGTFAVGATLADMNEVATWALAIIAGGGTAAAISTTTATARAIFALS